MTDSSNHSGKVSSNATKTGSWGDFRKLFLLFLIAGWLVGYFFFMELADKKTFVILAALVFMFIFDHIYSIALSAKTSEFFKSFLLQTAVPLSALLVVTLLAYTKSIDSQSTVFMFGLALAYTTYVVGKRLKESDEK